MMRLTWLVGLLVTASLGCGAEKTCEGEEGCACFANDTCMSGLTCLSHLCVDDNRPTSDVSREMDSSTPEPKPATNSDEPRELDSSTPEPKPETDSDEPRELDSSTPQLEIAPSPARWFRADEGLELADGAKVSIWRDQSGHAADATMADAARQPQWVAAGLNAKPEVLFGGAQSLYFPTFTSVEFTLFAVGRNANETDFHSIIIGPGGDTGNNQLRWDNGDTLMFVGLDINIPITEIPFGNTRESHLVTVRYTGSALEAYRNAEQRGLLATVSTGGWDVAQLGGWFSQDFMIGSLSEVVMYDRSLTDAELEDTQAALLDKYGL